MSAGLHTQAHLSSVMHRNLKFVHLKINFSTNIVGGVGDKYQACPSTPPVLDKINTAEAMAINTPGPANRTINPVWKQYFKPHHTPYDQAVTGRVF